MLVRQSRMERHQYLFSASAAVELFLLRISDETFLFPRSSSHLSRARARDSIPYPIPHLLTQLDAKRTKQGGAVALHAGIYSAVLIAQSTIVLLLFSSQSPSLRKERKQLSYTPALSSYLQVATIPKLAVHLIMSYQPPTFQASFSGNNSDGEEVWDQLNDAQTTEIQRHESRFNAPAATSRHRPLNIAYSMVAQTSERVGTAARAAYEAWNQPRYSPASTVDIDDSLDRQFGITADNPHIAMADTLIRNPTDNQEQQSESPNFVLLERFRMNPPRDGWGAAANLDLFLTNLYQYFYHRGLKPIVCKGIVEIFTLFFSLFLSVFLMRYLDWKKLSTCKDEQSCNEDLVAYITDAPKLTWFVRGYIIIFTSYTMFAIWSFWHMFKNALLSKYIMEDKLGISARKLQGGAVTWDYVVSRLLEAQQTGEYRLQISGQPLDQLIIAQRIMRKENFMIAYFNQNLFNCSVGGRFYFCKVCNHDVNTCVLEVHIM